MANIVIRVAYDAITGGNSASTISYDNSGSGLSATDVQAAIDELATSSSTRYVDTFNSTTDWALNVSDYQMLYSVAAHQKGANPNTSVFIDVAGVYEYVEPVIEVDGSGNVTIKVSSTPDNRFAGKVVIL